jgi:DNA-binding transcriptional MerR regulator
LTFEWGRSFTVMVMTTMRIAEVAERTGVPATTLRYYEEIGLLAPAARSGNGYRRYADRDLERLAFITRAKQLDLSLEELRELVDVWDDDCGQVRHLMTTMIASRLAQTRARIIDLVELTCQLQAAAARLASTPISEGACGDECACMATQTAGTELLPNPITRDPAGNESIPVACSLDSELARDRIADWQKLIAKATGKKAIGDGVALSFEHDVALTTEIAKLAAEEFQCCGFFRFNVAIDASGVRLEVGAPAEARDIITSVFGAPG